MARSKRLRATSTTSFQIDKLPSELVHMICSRLKQTEVANLRLVSRAAASVGLQYIVPEVHLVCAEDSFKQLDEVAKHPLVSKYVTSLVYEADRLEVKERKDWEEGIMSPEYLARICQIRKEGCGDTSERSCRSYNRALEKAQNMPRHTYTNQQLGDAFSIYTQLCAFQNSKHSLNRDAGIEKAIDRLPNLTKVIMSVAHGLNRPRTVALEKMFDQGYCKNLESHRTYQNVGVQPLVSLLLGLHETGRKIKSLECGFVHWRIFQQDDEVFAKMKESLSELQQLTLSISVGHGRFSRIEMQIYVQGLTTCLEGGQIRDLIGSASNLVQLNFSYPRETWHCPSDLKSVIGDVHWPRLTEVTLDTLIITHVDFIDFCKRHASTLKSLCFGRIELVSDNGAWWPLFEAMRKILNLDSMRFTGTLESVNGILNFVAGTMYEKAELRAGLEAYLIDKGEGRTMNLDDFLELYRGDWNRNGQNVPSDPQG